jgi:hypothetical protein
MMERPFVLILGYSKCINASGENKISISLNCKVEVFTSSEQKFKTNFNII